MTTGALPPEIDNETRDPACLAAALRYLDLGWSPIIVCPPDHAGTSHQHRNQCGSPGKSPIGRWKQYQTAAASAADLRGFWQRCPFGNVGIVTGRVSGIVAIDVDGELGYETLHTMAGGDLPITLSFSSGRDMGYRFIYSLEGYDGPVPTIPITVTGVQCLKILGDGSQTVAPPSRHSNGESYCWQARRAPGDTPIVPMPMWLADFMRNYRQDRSTPATQPREIAPTEIRAGARNTMLAQLAGSARRMGSPEHELLGLLQLANARCVDDTGAPAPLPDAELRAIAHSIAGYEPHNATILAIQQGFNPPTLPTATRAAESREAEVIELETVELVPINWLWRNWFPIRYVAIVEGHPGLGKSQLMVDIASRITRGDVMPDGSPNGFGEPRNVIIINHEDGAGDVLKPRHQAAGAVMSRLSLFHRIRSIPKNEFHFPVFPGPDLEVLEQMIRDKNAGMIELDPFPAYFDPKLDAWKDAEVRQFMMPFQTLAYRNNCVIVMVRHLTKSNSGGLSVTRGQGGIGFVGGARAGLVVDRHPDDDNMRVAAPFKLNYGPEVAGLDFQIVEHAPASRVQWLGQSRCGHNDLGRQQWTTPEQREERLEEMTNQQRAESILRRMFQQRQGPILYSAVQAAARQAGLHIKNFDRSARRIGVRRLEVNDPSNPLGEHAWELPSTNTDVSERGH